MKKTIKILKYVESLDCFIVTNEYKEVSDFLGLSEWNPVVWIGRLFLLDNDFGEHWFDNWDLRDEKEKLAKSLGIDYEELMIVNPWRFQNGKDGPCHSDEFRQRFWTDVLKSLELSYELLFDKARLVNSERKESNEFDRPIQDLEQRIEQIKARIAV